MLDPHANAINWFEIPATDIHRAKTFYETVLNTSLELTEMNGMKMTFLPHKPESQGIGGSIIQSDMHTPSLEGSVVYLNAGDDLQILLDRVESCGGKVMMPKTKINDEVGYIAMFSDTEGNRVAFHSRG